MIDKSIKKIELYSNNFISRDCDRSTLSDCLQLSKSTFLCIVKNICIIKSRKRKKGCQNKMARSIHLEIVSSF